MSSKRYIANSPGIVLSNLHLIILCFLAFLSYFIADEYGICYDARIQRFHGISAYNYILYGKMPRWPQYGVVFSLPMYLFDKFFNINTDYQIYFYRHFFAHSLFLFSALAFFKIAFWFSKNRCFALGGLCIYILSPRIYAHSFINPKDTVLLSLVTIFFWSVTLNLNKATFLRVSLMAFCAALCTAMRLQGLLTIFYGTFTLLFIYFKDYLATANFSIKDNKLKKIFFNFHFLNIIIFVVLSLLFLYALWPSLWSSPFYNLYKFFFSLNSHEEWQRNVFIFGKVYEHYNLHPALPFIWILITSPLTTIFLSLIGVIFLLFKLKKFNFYSIRIISDIISHLKRINSKTFYVLLVVISILLPVIAMITLKTKTYNGWRHIHFLHFSIAFLAFYGFFCFCSLKHNSFKYLKLIFLSIFIVNYLKVIYEMIIFHPYQQTYFNEYITFREKNFAKNNFDLDYWASGYLKATKDILKLDSEESIKIFYDQYYPINMIFIDKEGSKRAKFVKNPREADYIVSNFQFRWKKREYPHHNKVYSIYAFNSEIMGVYKNR